MSSKADALPQEADQQELEKSLALARNGTVEISESDFADSIQLAEDFGKVKMAKAIASGLNLSVIRWFAAMKESKAYKGKIIVGQNGHTFRPETFEQLCEGMGIDRKTIYEGLQNLAVLGPQYLEEAHNLGLKVRDFRRVRKALKEAPEDKREEVFSALRSAKDSPEELRIALDVVCEQLSASRAEKKQLESQIENLETQSISIKEDYKARGRLLEIRAKEIDELREKYSRASSPHPADVEERKILKDSNARSELDEKCTAALLAISELAAQASAIIADSEIGEETAAWVHGRLSLAVKDMAQVILGHGLDVDLEAEFSVDYGDAEIVDAQE